jgi:hypothetical protein
MPRQDHFVCEHLENISRRALERYQDLIREYVRRRPGVYALYRRDKLYYVGLASNLRVRLTAHLRDRHGDSWDRFSVYLTKSDTHLRELEALLLRIVKPKGNTQIGKFSRSANIQGRFAKDIRQRQSEERGLIFGTKPKRDLKRTTIAVSANGRQPSLASHIKRPIKIRARYKGKLVYAQVRRDGRIRFSQQLFDSPSLAAAAACARKTYNGWTFWEYERAPGDWVLLDELRK